MQIKKWHYQEANKTYDIRLEGDKLYVGQRYGEREMTIQGFFARQYSTGDDLAVDSEIRQYLVQHFDTPQYWDTQTYRKWQFWKAIDLDKIEGFELDITEKEHFPATFYFTKHGSYEKRTIGGGRILDYNRQQLEKVFFDGTRTIGLPLETRQKIKQTIWQALDENQIDFSYQDGFPLLQYEKIETQKWEKRTGEKGEYIELNNLGYAEIGGWSNWDQGGSQKYTLEVVLANWSSCLQGDLYSYADEIKAVIRSAIKP